jgi:hypothetical protein
MDYVHKRIKKAPKTYAYTSNLLPANAIVAMPAPN